MAEGAGDQGSGFTAWTIDLDLEDGTTYYWRVRAEEGALQGEFSATDEFLVSTLVGDFDGNKVVNFDDFFLFVDRFGETTSSPNFDADFDLDGSGSITFDDFFIFVDNFGTSASTKSWASSTREDHDARVSVTAVGGGRSSDRIANVRVSIANADQVHVFGLVVEYDPDKLEFVDASEGPGHFLEVNGSRAELFTVFSRDGGHVVLGNALTSGASVSGHGTLAELRFRLNGVPGDAVVAVTETVLGSADEPARRVTDLGSTTILPSSFALETNFPNPFNPSTTIEYALPVASPVLLSVYDLLGQKIRVLVSDSNHRAGYHTIAWDGRDDSGRIVGSGLYLYRLKAGDFTQVRKMTLLK